MSEDALKGLLRDYLISRGLTTTLRTFEKEDQTLKEQKLQVNDLIEEVVGGIDNQDFDRIKRFWTGFSTLIYHHLNEEQVKVLAQYENEIYRLYLASCHQKRNVAKFIEFFQKMSDQTKNNPEWTEWFALPYNDEPIENPLFRKYFEKSWKELFILSLHNFLSIIVKDFSETKIVQIADAISSRSRNASKDSGTDEFEEILEDFSIIAPTTGHLQETSNSRSKSSIKNFFKSSFR